MTATVQAHVPDTGIRGIRVPGSVRAMYIPADYTAPIDHVVLDGDMQEFWRRRFCCEQEQMRFTLHGWRAFLDAVKAGEFDGLLPEGA